MSHRSRNKDKPVCPHCLTTTHHQMTGHPNLWWCTNCCEYVAGVAGTSLAKSVAYQMALDGTNDLTYED